MDFFRTLALSLLVGIVAVSCSSRKPVEQEAGKRFDFKRDLLLVHYDCKTDVDDLQSVAAFATLIAHPDFANLNYHGVAGTYGTQGGLYVPPNDLFEKAFGWQWSDAHTDRDKALGEVKALALAALVDKGEVWIADGGQSDFSAALVRALRDLQPALNTKERIHIVQHASWNEEVTSAQALQYLKENADYIRIPDGNATGNGTPGFRSSEEIDLKEFISDAKVLSTWALAIDLSNRYNGVENRYLNQAIKDGGLDFSDFSEVCWILELDGIENSKDFFQRYGR